MMLPEINHNTIHGLPHYLSTPELIDNNNRGNKLATRIQKFTYIVEQQGKVVIPKSNLLGGTITLKPLNMHNLIHNQ